MHFGIVAIGSRGDVQPYVALGLGLKGRGHNVTLLAYENFRDFIEGYGLEFLPLSGNIEELLHTNDVKKMIRSGRFVALGIYAHTRAKETQQQINQELVAGLANADVLVTSLLGISWVSSIAEKTNKKWAIVQVGLPITPTKVFPCCGIDQFDFPLFNRFSYWVFHYGFWKLNKKLVNDFRLTLGLPTLKDSIFKKIANDKIPNLYCFSSTLLSWPHNWDEHVKITGFLFLPKESRDQNSGDQIPKELTDWLATGERPVYIGFGSIPVPDPELFGSVIKQMLTQTQHRFIFCHGWSRLAELPDHPNLFVVKSINHDWLFPRCKAAIIHGGIGTLAACMKARLPLIILSILYDQPFLGKIVSKKKIGIHIPFKKLTAEKLIMAIETSQSSEIRANTIDVGNGINNESGLETTVELLCSVQFT